MRENGFDKEVIQHGNKMIAPSETYAYQRWQTAVTELETALKEIEA